MEDEGARHLSIGLQSNTVRKLVFVDLFQINVYFSIQSLTTLDLSCNKIEIRGAEQLSKAIQSNTVEILFSRLVSN
jgi:hypothetical protein